MGCRCMFESTILWEASMLIARTSALLDPKHQMRAMVRQHDRQHSMLLGSSVHLERSLDCLQGHRL